MLRFAIGVVAPLALALSACGEAPVSGLAEDRAAPAFAVNDVSVLFPLPKLGEQDLLLAPKDAGAFGVVLPYDAYELAPTLTQGASQRVLYDNLRVVGVRFDPCFASVAFDDPACVHQIRLVLQPLTKLGVADASTVDAALHAFYRLDADEFATVAQAALALKRATGLAYDAEPLAVHPALKAQGLGGAFNAALKQLVLDHVGADRLTRLTFVKKTQSENSWTFGQFDRDAAGAFTASRIATLDVEEQTFIQAGSETSPTRAGTIDPQALPESPRALLDTEATKALSDAELTAGLADLLKIENPALFSPNTLDCASCHVAGNARLYVQTLRGVAAPDGAFKFVAPAGQNAALADETHASGNALGAFRYKDKLVSVSQRTVNESTLIADYLSRTLGGR
jgi:hypothetical protein